MMQYAFFEGGGQISAPMMATYKPRVRGRRARDHATL